MRLVLRNLKIKQQQSVTILVWHALGIIIGGMY